VHFALTGQALQILEFARYTCTCSVFLLEKSGKKGDGGEWLELPGFMSEHAPPHVSGKSTDKKSGVTPLLEFCFQSSR
jgi:hypothetical protein